MHHWPLLTYPCRLLTLWGALGPIEALELLDAKFSSSDIREFAVSCLSKFSDEQISDILPQLIQVPELPSSGTHLKWLTIQGVAPRSLSHEQVGYISTSPLPVKSHDDRSPFLLVLIGTLAPIDRGLTCAGGHSYP